jgi:hypothetical protein
MSPRRPLFVCVLGLVPFLAAFGSCGERNLGSLVPDDEAVDGGGKDAAGTGGAGGGAAADASTGGSTTPTDGGAPGADASSIDETPASMPDCPSVASSCPMSCIALNATRIDAQRGCIDDLNPMMTVGCAAPDAGTPPPFFVCVRRLQDGALFQGDPRLMLAPGWARCTEAEEMNVSLPHCPAVALPYAMRVEVTFDVDTGKKGVTLRWKDGLPSGPATGATSAMIERRFATFEALAAWNGWFDVLVAGDVRRSQEVSNWPCHHLASTFGYDEREFHVSRVALEIAPNGPSVTGSHAPFDGEQSCYRTLEAGVPAFGAVDQSQRVLRYWVETTATDLRMVLGNAEGVVLPERMAIVVTPTNAIHYGLSFSFASPLSTPAANVFLPLGLKVGGMRFGIEGRFDKCDATRSDLYLQERDLLGSAPLGFDPKGRIKCCTGSGCTTAVP